MDIRGQYRFSSLVKQNKKGKNYAVFCFARFFFIFFFCYEVIEVKKNYARSITTDVMKQTLVAEFPFQV